MKHVTEGLLNAWLDGALPAGDPVGREVGRHLSVCLPCRQRLHRAREHSLLCRIALQELETPEVRTATGLDVYAQRAAGATSRGRQLVRAAVAVLTCTGAALMMLESKAARTATAADPGSRSSPVAAPVDRTPVDVAPEPPLQQRVAALETLSSMPAVTTHDVAAVAQPFPPGAAVAVLPAIPLPAPPLTLTVEREISSVFTRAEAASSDPGSPDVLSELSRRGIAPARGRPTGASAIMTHIPAPGAAPGAGARSRAAPSPPMERQPAAVGRPPAGLPQPTTNSTEGGTMRHTCAAALTGILLALAGCDTMPMDSAVGDLQATISGDPEASSYHGSSAFRTAPAGLPRPFAFTLWSEGHGASAGDGFQFSSKALLSTGTYPLNAGSDDAAVYAVYSRRSGALVEKYSATAGVLEITSSTPDRIEGTFRFEGVKSAVCSTASAAVSCTVGGIDATPIEASGAFVAHRVHTGRRGF